MEGCLCRRGDGSTKIFGKPIGVRSIIFSRLAFMNSRQSRRDKKGYVYMLEVLIAVSIVVVFTANIYLSAQVPKTSTLELMKRQGFEALEYLDKTGELRYLAYSGNEVLLETRLKALLPSTISINTDICTTACTSSVPGSMGVASVDYYVSGYRDTFFAKKVKLWMWGSF